MENTRKTREFYALMLITLFFISFMAVFESVTAQTPLVTVVRLATPAGRGPFVEFASGQARSYLYNDTKAININVDGQTLSAPLVDARLQLTVPKIMYSDLEKGPNFMFSGENIVIRDWNRIIVDKSSDPDNYILSFPRESSASVFGYTISKLCRINSFSIRQYP